MSWPSSPVCWVPRRVPIIGSVSSGRSPIDEAILTPPALPRPPAWTCAFTTQREPPMSSATRGAARSEYTTSPGGTGMPDARRRSLAWYSWMFTRVSSSPGSDLLGLGGQVLRHADRRRVDQATVERHRALALLGRLL